MQSFLDSVSQIPCASPTQLEARKFLYKREQKTSLLKGCENSITEIQEGAHSGKSQQKRDSAGTVEADCTSNLEGRPTGPAADKD